MIHVGILSTASIVPRFISAAQETKSCVVEAIASRRIEAAQKVAEEFGISKAYGSYDELLADSDIDTVYIAMISSDHAFWSKRALEAGKNVLCEKPFALNPQDVAEIFDLAKQKKLFVMEMQKAVFLPVMSEIKKRIQKGEPGPVRMASFSSSFSSGYNNWFMDLGKGGGPWFSNAGYTASLLQFLFDCDVKDVSGSCTRSELTAENQFETVMTTDTGILTSCRCSTLVPLPNLAVLYCDNGRIEIPDFWKARSAAVYINNQEPEVLGYPCKHELIYEIEHAAECISNGLTESPVMTGKISVSTADILFRMSQAWKSKGLIG